MKFRVVPIALAVALSGGVPGVIAAAAPAAAATAAYTMTDLGSLGLGVSRGLGINAGAEVVGGLYIRKPSRPPAARPATGAWFTPNHAFSWSAGTMTDLTPGTQNFSTATAINMAGDTAGTVNGSGFLLHDGKMTSLGAVGPAAINDVGEIAGGTQGHAFLLSGGKLTILPGLSSYADGLSGAADHVPVPGAGSVRSVPVR